MGKNEKAYLNVEYVRRGDLSNEIFVKVKDYQGKEIKGIFQDCHFNKKDNSKLIVDILGEKDDNILVGVPHGGHLGFYDETQTPIKEITIKQNLIGKI
jgi:hypothetical protein